MHLGIRESVALARGVLRSLRGKEVAPEVIICPSFTALSEIHKVTARSRVRIGAQNCGPERMGSFTGETSTSMLEDIPCSFVIVGHSERRNQLGETNELINKKLKTIFGLSKLTPILCVGEPMDVRDSANAMQYVAGQLKTALDKVSISKNRQLIVAYEPVWAIGTGSPANIGDVVEMHQFIRSELNKITQLPARQISIIYGGSVDADNVYQFLRESQIDGVLVGGASRKLQQFDAIIKAGIDVMEAQAGKV